MTNTAILIIAICMVSCIAGEKERISEPGKAHTGSTLEFLLNFKPSTPPKIIAYQYCKTHYYTPDISCESSLIGISSLWDSAKWKLPIHLKEDAQRWYWYIWQQNNEQCVSCTHLFKYGLATYWDNIYIHSTQIQNDRPGLAPSNDDDNLDKFSKIEIGLKLIEAAMRVMLPIIVMTLLPLFIYQLYSWGDYIHRKFPTPGARYNTKEVTWVCRCGTILQDRVSERILGAADSYATELCTPLVRQISEALDFECSIDLSWPGNFEQPSKKAWQSSLSWDGGLIYWNSAALTIMMETLTGDLTRTWIDNILIVPRGNLTRSSLFLAGWIIKISAAMSCNMNAVKLQQISFRRQAIFNKDEWQRPPSWDGRVLWWYSLAAIIPFYLDVLTSDLIRTWFDGNSIIPQTNLAGSSLSRFGWIMRVLAVMSCFIPAVKLQQTSLRRLTILRHMMSKKSMGKFADQVQDLSMKYDIGDRSTSKPSACSVDTMSLSQKNDAQTAVGNEAPQHSNPTPHFGHSRKLEPRKRPQKDTTLSTDARQMNVLIAAQPESLYLLLCIPQYKYATKVVHMDVKALTSDQQLFAGLRTHYITMRGRFRMLLSLKRLTSIDFVQFEAYKSDLADVKKENDIPPLSRSSEYRYRPMPADNIPPIGKNHMMHLYEHPDHAEDLGICLDKMPKKMKERLAICPNRGTGVGWGVHFFEGLNWLLLYMLGLLGLSLGILFGVLWANFKNDVQGGFGIAACIMLGFSFTVGIVQAAYEQK